MTIENPYVRRRFGLSTDTDMDNGYFNEVILITDSAPWLLNPERKREDYHRHDEMEQRALNNLRGMRRYLEKISINLESNKGDFPNLQLQDFVTDKNRDKIARLDQIVDEMRQLGQVSKFDELDREKIRQLAYEATVLIYGEKHREDAKRRFRVK